MTPRIVSARRRANLVWLVAALAALLAAGGISLFGARADAGTAALELEAERVANAIEIAAKSAHVQADGIAGTPMVRSAISTDAATMTDIAQTEIRFSRNPGETLELFQLRGDEATTLLRLPPHGTPVKLVRGREKRLENSGGGGLDVVAGAPIVPQDPKDTTAVAGQVAISIPVDLASARRQLMTLTNHATIEGVGPSLVLVPGEARSGTAASVPVRLDESWQLPAVTLSVRLPDQRPPWVAPARIIALALGVALLAVFVLGMRKPSRH